MRLLLTVFLTTAWVGFSGQGPHGARKPDPVRFEATAPPGLQFAINPGKTARRHQPETMIAGVALLDYDNDGLIDVYLVNGASMPGLEKSDPTFYNRLFRHLPDGSYRDVTERAGVRGRGYTLGVSVGDYDNDGFEDMFVAGLRENILYHNNGDGTFTDVTVRAGLAKQDPQYGNLWAVSAAWLDFDRDGWLDLLISNYCVWDPKLEPACPVFGLPDYCHPNLYKGLPNSLFRNNHDGSFTDVSAASGIRKSIGKGMGIGVADFNEDGWPDFFVANDTVPNSLFLNQRDGTFKEVAAAAFVAYTDNGKAVSGMGVDARDIDNDGRPDVFETAMVGETMPFFWNAGQGVFEERTFTSGLATLTQRKSGWSNGIYDFNNDGWKDLFAACGDVMDKEGFFAARVPQSNSIFLNSGNGIFVDGSPDAGPDFARKAIHRGAAFGDLDNDGRIDVVVSALQGPLEVWRNISSSNNHWLLVRTVGSKSNRDGMGAKLKVVTASGTQYNQVNTAVGYGCSSDIRVHFGLGANASAKEIQITWPSGTIQVLKDVKADQVLIVREN